MTKINQLTVVATLALVFFATTVQAHFGTITPSDDIVSQKDSKTLQIEAKFIHPMGLHYMEMEKPKQFGVLFNGNKQDLRDGMTSSKGKSPDQEKSYTFWQAEYEIGRPGDYTFYMEPTPYWEPAEDLFIIHYTKVCVNALGLEDGWDKPVGLETEIIPLTRPYGLWTGNLFTGQVFAQGKPVPNAEVEVEYLNEFPGNVSQIVPPSEPYVTQVVKADSNGVFSYAMPKAGWWGFAALNKAPWKLKYEGEDKSVEIGAVYWVRTRDLK